MQIKTDSMAYPAINIWWVGNILLWKDGDTLP